MHFLSYFNPFRGINRRLDQIMSLVDDTKAAADAANASVQALNTTVDTLVTGFNTVSQQLADLQANGSMSDADKATLQASIDELNGTVTAANAERDKVAAAQAPSPSPSPAPAPSSGDTGLPTLG